MQLTVISKTFYPNADLPLYLILMVSHVKAKLRMRAYDATGSGGRKVSRKYNSICFSIFIHKTVPIEPRLDSVSTEPAIPIRIRT